MYTVNQELVDKLGITQGALAGRTALVTGSARGIGEAAAMTMASLGANVVIVDKRPEGQAVADAIQKDGGKAHFILCDLSHVDELMQMITQATAVFDGVDILVNSAVLMPPGGPTPSIPLEVWEETFATNIRVPFLTIKHLLPPMLERKQGVIVNMIAYEGSPLAAAYAATKTASRSLALSVAREVGTKSGVSVFSFVPGVVDTPLMDEVIPQTAALLGLPEETVIELVAQNPGYSGLMPRDHCATALVYTIVHAPEYHAQIADPFEPLSRFGVIERTPLDKAQSTEQIGIAGAVSQHLKQYLDEVTVLNQELEQRIDVRTRELAEARARSETLLLNILPEPIAERLKQGENMIADRFDEATVLFADIAGFTPMSAGLPPERVVEVLDTVFTAFDAIAGHYELEKIKTIGDCYMMVGGLPGRQPDHADLVAHAALDMLPVLAKISKDINLSLSARIGLHSGPVVAGVIGRQKFIYDLWGDTVNTASRMESHGVRDRIHCTEKVYTLLNGRYQFEPRGETDIKGKGVMPTYFLVGSK